MSGNIRIFLIWVTLCYVTPAERNSLYRGGDIKGGLVFEKDVETPRIINPNYLAYKRKLNLNDVLKAVDLTHEFMKIYKSFCDSIKQSIDTGINVRSYTYRHKFYIVPGQQNIWYAGDHCKAVKADLPEIRTRSELNDLMNFAKENHITNINVNIFYDEKTDLMRYGSDRLPTTNVLNTVLIENPASKTLYSKTNIYDYLARAQWKKGNHAFLTIQDNEPVLKSFVHNVNGPYEYVICRKKHTPTVERDNTFLLDMAEHMCNRDYNQLKGMTDVVGREASLFLSKDDDKTVIASGDHKDCPSIAILDQHKVTSLKKLIHQTARLVATRANYPVDVTRKYLIFKALTLHTQEEFRKFLDTDFKRIYLTLNPTQTLLYNLACQFETENENITPTKGVDFNRFFETNVDIEVEPIFGLINSITSPLSIVRQKRALKRNKRAGKINLTAPSIPDATSLFSSGNFGYFLGIATVADVKRTYEVVARNAIALQDISVNQIELKNAYDNLKYEIETLQNVTQMQDIAVYSLTSVMDNRNVLTQLHNTIRQSLLIIANSITSAKAGNVSPYIFSERELTALSNELKNNNMFLTSDIKDVHTSIYKIDNEYNFILSIPIIDNKYMFRIYTIRNFPIFSTSEETHKVIPDMAYVAISIDTTTYAELTEIEYQHCASHSFCKISGPIGTITSTAHCVAQTFKDRTRVCPTEITNDSRPFFATYGDKTLFSSPLNLEGSLVCPTKEVRGQDEAISGKIKFSGVGTIHLKPTCFVSLPDGRTIAAQFETNIATDLGVSTMNEAFKYSPSLENYTFTKQHVNIFAEQEIPEISLTHVDVNSIKYITELALSPNEVVKHLIRFIIIIIVGAVLFTIAFLVCPKFRRWVKACCLCKPPTKYWNTKGYEHPIFFPKGKDNNKKVAEAMKNSGIEPEEETKSASRMERIMRFQHKKFLQRSEIRSKNTEENEKQEKIIRDLNNARLELSRLVREPIELKPVSTRNLGEHEYAIPTSSPREYGGAGYLPASPFPKHIATKIAGEQPKSY